MEPPRATAIPLTSGERERMQSERNAVIAVSLDREDMCECRFADVHLESFRNLCLRKGLGANVIEGEPVGQAGLEIYDPNSRPVAKQVKDLWDSQGSPAREFKSDIE